MANKTRSLVAVAVTLVAGNWELAGASARQQPQTPTVWLRVTNATAVFPATLQRAQQEATRIYEAAGVSLVWTTDDRAPTYGAAMRLGVVLVPKFDAERLLRDAHLPNTVLGVAPDSTRRAYIFCDRVRWKALSDGFPMETVLGRVVAHEIGHHLLPREGHSNSGIMQERVNYNPAASPGFTPAQAASIRAHVMQSR